MRHKLESNSILYDAEYVKIVKEKKKSTHEKPIMLTM